MSITIITDTTSDLSLEEAQQLGVVLAPLKVQVDGSEYLDKFTLTNELFYELLASSKGLPVTSQVNPQEFCGLFDRHPGNIVAVFLSSKLSGTYQSAVIAKEQLGRENIYLIDSDNVTMALELLVRRAVKLRDEGRSAEEIFDHLEKVKENIGLIAALDTLRYLVKGGRLGGMQGFFGEVMGVKPLVSISEGVIHTEGKVRGIRNATQKLLEMVAEQGADFSQPAVFGHSNNQDQLMPFVKQCKKTYGIENYTITSIGSVVGTHAGPGAIAIAYFKK